MPVTIKDSGRGIDQNGDGNIDSTEGVNAAPPRGIIASRDGFINNVRSGADRQCARLGAGSAAGSRRGGRNVNAIATAPRPMPNEPM
jgi:hypothetical protein